jgi:hypothetical protein
LLVADNKIVSRTGAEAYRSDAATHRRTRR